MKSDHSPVQILLPPPKLRDIGSGPSGQPPAKKPPGCCGIICGLFALLVIIVIAGSVFSSHVEKKYGSSLPDPNAGTPLERKVRADLQREEAGLQRAVQETLERIRQRQ